MKLSCFIIDDEPLAIEVLESYISKLDSIEIAGTFGNAIKAFEALQKKEVDVMFLDIQMPKLTGVELLKALKNPPLVIFTTAYREYAVDGFELNAVDYLLKPISFERFLKAVYKIQELINKPHEQIKTSPDGNNHFFVTSGKEKVKIRLTDVLYLESKGDYVLIKTLDKEIQTYATLTSMEKKLGGGSFIRVHRSFIVNIHKIESWSQTDIQLAGQIIPIGRSYKKQTIQSFNKRFDAL